MREHGLGPFGRADLHPRRNPLDRQGRLAPQPGSDGQLAGVAAPASGQLGLLPAPARKLLRDDAVGPLLGGLPVEFPGVVLAKLTLPQLQHLLFELLAAQVPAPPPWLGRFLVDGLQPAPFHLPLELLTPRCGVLPNGVLAQQAVHAHGARHEPNRVRPPPASQTPKTASPPLPPLSGRFTRTNLRFDPFPRSVRYKRAREKPNSYQFGLSPEPNSPACQLQVCFP